MPWSEPNEDSFHFQRFGDQSRSAGEPKAVYRGVRTAAQELRGTEYYSSESIAGSKHFGVWPLSEAAEACFGTTEWPADRPVPQFSIEFEVENADTVAAAAKELEAKGYRLLHPARTEPWGQTVARMQTSEGAILGISYAPWMHQAKK